LSRSVHGSVRSRHLDGAEGLVPARRDDPQGSIEVTRSVTEDQRPCVLAGCRLARRNTISIRSSRRSSIVAWSTPQGSRPAPIRPESRPVARGPPMLEVPLRPRNSSGHPSTPSAPRRGRNATRVPKSRFQVLRASIAPVVGSISVTTNGAEAPRDTPRTHSTYAVTDSRRDLPGVVLHRETGDLRGSSSGHELQELERGCPWETCSNRL